MKIKLLAFFLLISFGICAQTNATATEKTLKEKPAKKDGTDSLSSNIEAYYGYKTFFHDFRKQLNTVYKFNIGQPVQLVGVGASGHFIVDRGGDFYGHFLYNYIIPQPVSVNDSIHCKMTGFIFSFAYGAGLVSNNHRFLTSLYIGFNTGRLRFYGDEQVRQKNPFFSPKIGIQPKLAIGKFTVTLVAEAEYDVSKTSWRRLLVANKDKTSIDKFRQSGITTLIGISYRLINYANDKSDDWDHAQ